MWNATVLATCPLLTVPRGILGLEKSAEANRAQLTYAQACFPRRQRCRIVGFSFGCAALEASYDVLWACVLGNRLGFHVNSAGLFMFNRPHASTGTEGKHDILGK